MTKRERAQVVELLRCAADVGSLFAAGIWPQQSTPSGDAWEAKRALQASFGHPTTMTEKYRELLLEAAQRVEEGSWP